MHEKISRIGAAILREGVRFSNAKTEDRATEDEVAVFGSFARFAKAVRTDDSATPQTTDRQATGQTWKRLLKSRVTLAVMDGDDAQHPVIRGLKTVCRCNNIKYRTIERAIREGAWTLSQIADRTTATTGHCGGSCTPDVLQMLAEHAPKHALNIEDKPPAAVPVDAWWIKKDC